MACLNETQITNKYIVNILTLPKKTKKKTK